MIEREGIANGGAPAAAQPRPELGNASHPQGHRHQPRVGVVAVQGAFAEHIQRLRRLGCATVELRQGADLARPIDALVLPGGESTVQSRLLRDAGMLEPLRERILAGLPVLGTCAGLILLAERVEGSGDLRGLDPQKASGRTVVEGLRTLPVTVSRNAYGRQLGSFHAEGSWEPAGSRPAAEAFSGSQRADEGALVPLTFIRAPRIEQVGPGAQVLVALDGQPVAVQHGAQIAAAFHPELDEDNRLFERFLALIG